MAKEQVKQEASKTSSVQQTVNTNTVKQEEVKTNGHAASVSTPNWEKKITTKGVMGKKINGGMVESGPIKLYSIIGVCTGIKTGESQYGGWVGFTGTFEAVRISDGAVFNAPVAFIPEPASGMTLAALTEAQQRSQGAIGGVSVRFAFIVGAKPSEKAAGFEYYVEPIMQASENDALAEMRALIAPRLALTQS